LFESFRNLPLDVYHSTIVRLRGLNGHVPRASPSGVVRVLCARGQIIFLRPHQQKRLKWKTGILFSTTINCFSARTVRLSKVVTKEATKGENKGAEAPAPLLAKSKLQKKIIWDSFGIFCVSAIWSCLIWPIYGLKSWLWHSKTSKSHIKRRSYNVIKITSPKIFHQYDVTKLTISRPSLEKSWLPFWFVRV